MPVPEAPVNEQGDPEFGENYVWLTWKVSSVESESVACCVQSFADRDFGRGVL